MIAKSPLGLVGGLPFVLVVMLAAHPGASTEPTVGQLQGEATEIRIHFADSILGASENAQRLRVRVEASVDYDSLGRLYHYVYTVFNDASSDSTLETFVLRTVPAGPRIESPKYCDACPADEHPVLRDAIRHALRG